MAFTTTKVTDDYYPLSTQSRRIARDSTGRIWVAMRKGDQGSGGIAVAYSDDDGASWTVEDVYTSNQSIDPCIAVDDQDYVHLAYCRWDTDDYIVRYERRAGGVWANASEFDDEDEHRDPQLVVDDTGTVHLAYVSHVHTTLVRGDVKYRSNSARGVSGSWSAATTVFADAGEDGKYGWYNPAMAVDSQGYVYLVAYTKIVGDPTIGKLYHRKKTGAAWGDEVYISDALSPSHGGSSLAVDNKDRVHIVYAFYQDAAPTQIAYHIYASGMWSVAQLLQDDDGVTRARPSVGIDNENTVYVAWDKGGSSGGTMDVMVKSKAEGGSWSDESNASGIGCSYDNNERITSPSIMWQRYPATSRPDSGVYLVFPHYNHHIGDKFQKAYFAKEGTFNPLTIPVVNTEAADNYDCTLPGLSCDMNGHLTDDGRGGLGSPCYFDYCRGTEDDPTSTSSQDKVSGDDFEASLSIPAKNALWWFRAAAMNALGIAYGKWYKAYCTDLDGTGVPEVTTVAATNVEATTATINGTLTDGKGASAICYFAWGKTKQYFNYTTSEVVAHGDDFHFDLTGLMPNTLYHFQARAINDEGEGEGEDLYFMTKGPHGYEEDNIGVVGTIRRVYESGVYRMELGLGGFGKGITTIATADPEDPEATIEPDLVWPGPTGLRVEGEYQVGESWWDRLLEELLRILPHNFFGLFRGDKSPFGLRMSPTIDQIHRMNKPIFSWTTPYMQTRVDNTETRSYENRILGWLDL